MSYVNSLQSNCLSVGERWGAGGGGRGGPSFYLDRQGWMISILWRKIHLQMISLADDLELAPYGLGFVNQSRKKIEYSIC